MERIDALLPGSGKDDLDGLRELDADTLARYVIDTGNPWWRRRRCVTVLDGRVPRPLVPPLLERIRDTSDTTEVRVALLELLADEAELLPWLRHPDREAERYAMSEAIVGARGVAGDRSALSRLTDLANNDWPHRRALGVTGLDALVVRYGREAILADLDPDRPQDRASATRLRHDDDRDITDALADPDATVAHLAATLIEDTDRLRACLDQAPSLEAKLWAAWALHELTGNLAETRENYRSLGSPRVEVDGLDEEVRAAIVREWVPRCQRRTDPRWRLEALCAAYPAVPDTDEQLGRATTALARAGLEPQPPMWSGDESPGGYGTYHTIEQDGGSVWLSTLGRFVTSHDSDAARGVLEAAGFRWIDDAFAELTVTGLHTYYFGDRGTRPVHKLLFHWTD